MGLFLIMTRMGLFLIMTGMGLFLIMTWDEIIPDNDRVWDYS
jgi:hypothetical protein